MSDRRLAPVSLARLAGVLYLVIIVCGVWSEGFVRSALVVEGDALLTAQNILEREALFRLSFLADVVMALCDVGLAVLLYRLLRPAGEVMALAATAFRLVQAAILGGNLLHQQAALWALDPASGVDPAQALVQMGLQSQGYDLGLFFFGVNSLLVGVLLWRAPWFPRALGAGMVAAGAVYLVGSTLRFVAPGAYEVFAPAYGVTLLAEGGLCLWLLARGLRAQQWRQSAPEAEALTA